MGWLTTTDHKRMAVMQIVGMGAALLMATLAALVMHAEMLTAAFASRYHWREIGEPKNFSVSDWQVSRVAAVLGLPDLAERYFERLLEVDPRHGESDSNFVGMKPGVGWSEDSG